ncbi:MAG: hypothetical protein IPK28_20770 [Devosia sp.]|nr:hypothetical protein [Devosia sp.]
MRPLLLALAALALLIVPVMAQTDAGTDATLDLEMGDHMAFRAAFEAIQAAVVAGDAIALAEYIPFGEPITVNGQSRVFPDADAFVAAYGEIFTPDVVEAVVAQTYTTLFVNSEGVMFGNGEVWIGGLCNDAACDSFDVKILAIQSTRE